MPGNYSVTTRASGSILTATIYNTDHAQHVTYATPGGLDDASATATAMRATADPGENGTESLPTDLLGELQRIRHIIAEITGKTYWYETPDTALSSLFLKGADIASATTLIPVGEFYFADVTGSVTINGIDTEDLGKVRRFRFTGAPLLTHNATSFILPGGANYQVVAGQTIEFWSLGSGNWLLANIEDSGAFRHTSSGGYRATITHANTADRTYTLQDSSDTLVGRATTDTLTNKTLTNPSIGGAAITGAAPATPTANVLYTDSLVKGFVAFQVNGTIDTDLNVSSITDNGVGDWTVNWATAFTTANYVPQFSFQGQTIYGGANPFTVAPVICNSTNPTTSALRVNTGYADGGGGWTLIDPQGTRVRLYVTAHGLQ